MLDYRPTAIRMLFLSYERYHCEVCVCPSVCLPITGRFTVSKWLRLSSNLYWSLHSSPQSLTICGDACPISCFSAEACFTSWPNAVIIVVCWVVNILVKFAAICLGGEALDAGNFASSILYITAKCNEVICRSVNRYGWKFEVIDRFGLSPRYKTPLLYSRDFLSGPD